MYIMMQFISVLIMWIFLNGVVCDCFGNGKHEKGLIAAFLFQIFMKSLTKLYLDFFVNHLKIKKVFDFILSKLCWEFGDFPYVIMIALFKFFLLLTFPFHPLYSWSHTKTIFSFCIFLCTLYCYSTPPNFYAFAGHL